MSLYAPSQLFWVELAAGRTVPAFLFHGKHQREIIMATAPTPNPTIYDEPPATPPAAPVDASCKTAADKPIEDRWPIPAPPPGYQGEVPKS